MQFKNVWWKVKVKLSLGHKAVITTTIHKIKNFLYKSYSVWYAISECLKKSKSYVEQSTVICSQISNLITF